MDQNRIEKLGTYFVFFHIRDRFDITFENFIEMVDRGDWKHFIGGESSDRRRNR